MLTRYFIKVRDFALCPSITAGSIQNLVSHKSNVLEFLFSHIYLHTDTYTPIHKFQKWCPLTQEVKNVNINQNLKVKFLDGSNNFSLV